MRLYHSVVFLLTAVCTFYFALYYWTNYAGVQEVLVPAPSVGLMVCEQSRPGYGVCHYYPPEN